MGILRQYALLVLAVTLGNQVQAGRIFGGHEVKPHSRPHMVWLECLKENGDSFHCDGFLLNEDFVMTAAHCKASSYYALLGLHHYTKNPEQRIFVGKSFPHENFTEQDRNLINDIMLLKLSRKATFNKHVRPITLAEPEDENQTMPQNCSVSGWGRTESTNELSSDILMEVNVTLDDTLKYCTKDHIYCSTGQSGPREGDSGGPLVCDGLAHGVVSFTLTTENLKIHAYTMIPYYRDWIDGIMNGPSTHDIYTNEV